MTDRKQTPDILGEVLGGDLPWPGPEVPEAAEPPVRRRASRPAERTPRPAARGQKWEYLVVSFHQHRGWRPRFINGREIPDWTAAPVLHEYIAQLGEDGWELASATAGERLYGSADRYQVFFKRPKQ